MSHCTNNSTKTGRKLLFFSGFRRHVREFLGSILALFRPSGPLCFPVRQVRFQPREEEQQQQQEQQEGSMSHMSHCTTSGIKTGRKLLFF